MSGEPDTTQKKLTENITTLVQTTCIVLQWIPVSASIRENEIADQLTKEGREKEQPSSHLSYREVKTLFHKKESHLSLQDWKIQLKSGCTPTAALTPTDHHLSPQKRPLQTEQPSQEDWRKALRSTALWRGRPNTRTLPTVLLTPPASKAADVAHSCVPQKQALGVCRGFVPDIQVCCTHGKEDLATATITSNAEEESSLSQTSVGTLSLSCKTVSQSMRLLNLAYTPQKHFLFDFH